MAKSEQLTTKQKAFCQEYIIDFNGAAAARRAGYSKKTATVIGSQNLLKLNIQAEIQKAIDERSSRTNITQDMVVSELAKLGFHNMMDYIEITSEGDAIIDLSKLTREQAAAITEITIDEYTEGKGDNQRDIKKVKVKLSDKKGALGLLGKHLGMFVDKVKIEGNLSHDFKSFAEFMQAATGRLKKMGEQEDDGEPKQIEEE